LSSAVSVGIEWLSLKKELTLYNAWPICVWHCELLLLIIQLEQKKVIVVPFLPHVTLKHAATVVYDEKQK
jgi:hypothetical protein